MRLVRQRGVLLVHRLTVQAPTIVMVGGARQLLPFLKHFFPELKDLLTLTDSGELESALKSHPRSIVLFEQDPAFEGYLDQTSGYAGSRASCLFCLLSDPSQGGYGVERLDAWVGDRLLDVVLFRSGGEDGLRMQLRQCLNLASRLLPSSAADEDGEASVGHLNNLVEQQTSLLRQRNERLEYLAARDPLTGLYNRRHLEERMALEMARLHRYGQGFSIALFDLDHFKHINDSLGHAAGDEVLKHVSGILEQSTRSVDFVGRFGGEEFLVCLPNTPLANARLTAERLRVAIAGSTLVLSGQEIRVTVSGGVSEVTQVDLAWQEVLERADTALYQAKASGRNCVKSAEPSVGPPILHDRPDLL